MILTSKNNIYGMDDEFKAELARKCTQGLTTKVPVFKPNITK